MEQEIRHRLRDEYFKLLPDLHKILEELEAKISYALIPIKKKLKRHESIVMQSRVKNCESAIASLKRKQQGGFSPDKADEYSLLELEDLAGVRVLVFPRRHIQKIDSLISELLRDWTFDPIKREDSSVKILVNKYFGYIDPEKKIYCEYQIAPMLIGLFWQVEHAALYKPSLELKGIEEYYPVLKERENIYDAFSEFEKRFEELVIINIDKGYYKT